MKFLQTVLIVILLVLRILSVYFVCIADALSSVMLVGLMTIQNIRRLLECIFLSVYSPQGTMNVLHYLLAMVFYTSFSFAVLSESPDPAEFGVYVT